MKKTKEEQIKKNEKKGEGSLKEQRRNEAASKINIDDGEEKQEEQTEVTV